jgi:hypothetical protein
MWQRRTFHECASELIQISEEFRAAHMKQAGCDGTRRDDVMLEASRRGVEVLRVLALAIRSDQDYGRTARPSTQVGALKLHATPTEIADSIRSYRPPYRSLRGYQSLDLRGALNKVAHLDPSRSSYFADARCHDLILAGDRGVDAWIAVISLLDLCSVIQALPDATTGH